MCIRDRAINVNPGEIGGLRSLEINGRKVGFKKRLHMAEGFRQVLIPVSYTHLGAGAFHSQGAEGYHDSAVNQCQL